jgi:hypothetical protein
VLDGFGQFGSGAEIKSTNLPAQSKIVSLRQMFNDFSGAEPEEMKLTLPDRFASGSDAEEISRMPTLHRGYDQDTIIFGKRLKSLKLQIGEDAAEPPGRRKKAGRPLKIAIRLIGIVFGLSINEILADNALCQGGVGSLDDMKGLKGGALIALQAHVLSPMTDTLIAWPHRTLIEQIGQISRFATIP